ncbi:MAG: hypothetical protein RIR00_2542 [Pseudomonadota bacterium]|jgi:uncharacterized protein
MFKFLLFVGLAYLVWRWWRGQQAAQPESLPEEKPAEAMIPCAWCGVHGPATEMLRDEQGRHFCDAAHRRALQQRDG